MQLLSDRFIRQRRLLDSFADLRDPKRARRRKLDEALFLGFDLVELLSELGIPVTRARVTLCTLIMSQTLPDAVAIRGGIGVNLRLGERRTRPISAGFGDKHCC